MEWSVVTVVGTLLVGFGSGVLSAMFGVGGAVLTTPGVRVMGATPIEAVGSTVPAILPSAITGTIRYAKEGLVDWRVGLVCGATGAVVAVAGAIVADHIDAHWLMLLTAALLGYSAVSLWRSGSSPAPADEVDDLEAALSDGEHLPPADVHAAAERAAAPLLTGRALDGERAPHSMSVLAGTGVVAGLLAGLLGVGGGVVMVPAFTRFLRLPVKVAVASSLVAVAIFSLPALVTHAVLGHINWAFALLLTVGVVPGARLGSRITLATSDARLRHSFAVFLSVLAVVYGGAELLSIVWGA